MVAMKNSSIAIYEMFDIIVGKHNGSGGRRKIGIPTDRKQVTVELFSTCQTPRKYRL